MQLLLSHKTGLAVELFEVALLSIDNTSKLILTISQHYLLLCKCIRVTSADNAEAKLSQSWLVVISLCMP